MSFCLEVQERLPVQRWHLQDAHGKRGQASAHREVPERHARPHRSQGYQDLHAGRTRESGSTQRQDRHLRHLHIIWGKWFCIKNVVIETIFNDRTNHHLRFWEQLFNRMTHQVRT